MDPGAIKAAIETGLPGAVAEVSGDGRHFQARVVCAGFEGKTTLARHRLIYAVLEEALRSDALHALSLRTLTPAERALEK